MGTYKVFARRWLVLAIGFIINFALWSVSHPFTIPSTAGRWLCASEPIPVIQTRFVSYAWFISSIVGALPGLWLMKSIGLRKALTISVSFMVLGVSLRCVVFAAHGMAREPDTGDSTCSKAAYWWILGGNCLAALGAVPIQASVATLAATWFPASQFGMAATLMSLSIPAGLHSNLLIIHLSERSKLLAIDFDRELIVHVAIAALALLAVPLLGAAPPIKPCITAEPPYQSERDLEDVASATSSQNGVSAAQELLAPLSPLGDSARDQGGGFCVPTSDAAGSGVASVVPNSPAGTISQQLERERQRLDGPLLAEVKAVLLFPNFWKILIAFSAGMGSCMVYYLLLEEFLDSVSGPFLENSINLPVVAGSFAAIAVPASVLSCLLDCTRGHKWIIAASQTVVAALAAVLTIGISSAGAFENIQACLICMSVMAFLAIPIALDITTERTLPIRPALPTAILWVGMSFSAATLGILTDTVLVNNESPRPHFSGAKYMLLACFIVAAVMWWLVPVRYVRRAVEDTYKESLQLSSASHSRLSSTESRGLEPRSGRMWISGASGRITVPSINRNLYIIAEEHGTTSSGGYTGGGTGSIRNLPSATGTDADRLSASTDSLRDQVPQLPQLSHSHATLPAAQALAGSRSHSGDSNSGNTRQQGTQNAGSNGRLPSQMEISEHGPAGSDVSIKLPMTDSQHSEQLRDRVQRPMTGDLRFPRPPTSGNSLSQSTSNSTINARESQRISSRSTGSDGGGGLKGSAESVAGSSSSHANTLKFSWRLPPFSYFLGRGSGVVNSGSSSISKTGRPQSSTFPASGSVSGGETTISRSSSHSMSGPRGGSSIRSAQTSELAGKSDASLIRWMRDAHNGGDSATGESSIVSGTTVGAGGSVASSVSLAHQLRKPSSSLASGTIRAARLASGSMSNESVSEAGMGHPKVKSDSHPSERPLGMPPTRPHTAPSIREASQEVAAGAKKAPNARLQAQIHAVNTVAHGQVHANSMMGHVSDSGAISEDWVDDARGARPMNHSGRALTTQPKHHPQHGVQQAHTYTSQASAQRGVSSASAHMHDPGTSVALSSTSAAASVSLEGTATVALREKVEAVQSTALQSLGRPVHVSSVAAAAEAAAAAQQVELQPQHGQQTNTDDVGDTLVGAGTLTGILQPGDMGDAERFADPFSPRGSQSRAAENLSNLSLSTARTTVVAAASVSGSTEDTAAVAADGATPTPATSQPVSASSPHQRTAGSASGTGISPADVPGSSHLVSTMSSVDTKDIPIPYGAPARGSMVWWANPLGDRQSPDGTPVPAAIMSTAGTDQMSSFAAKNDQSVLSGHGNGIWTQDTSTAGAPSPDTALQGHLKYPSQLSDDISAAVIDLDHSTRLQPCDAQEDPMADSGMLELNPQVHKSSVPGNDPSSSGVPRRHPLSPVNSSPTSRSQGQSTARSGSFRRAPSSHKANSSSRRLGDTHENHSRPLEEDSSYARDDETPFHSPRTPGRPFNASRSPSASPQSHHFLQPASPVNDESAGYGGQQGEHDTRDDGGDTIVNTISFAPSPGDPHIAGRTVMHSIDGLLHSSLQSSQLFGSVLAPQIGTTLGGAAHSSQMDPVSAIAVRMQHHDATSSVLQPFSQAESALLQPHAGLYPGPQLSPVRMFPGLTPSQDWLTKSQDSTSSPTALTSQPDQSNTDAAAPQSASAVSPPVLSLSGAAPTQGTDPSQPPAAPQRSRDAAAESSTYELSSMESFTRLSKQQNQVQQPEEATGSFEGLEDTILESNCSAPRSLKPHTQKGVPLNAVLPAEKREMAASRTGLTKFSLGSQAKKWLANKKKAGSLFESSLITSPDITASGVADAAVHKGGKGGKGNASNEVSMCLDTYPEAPSGKLVRDRSMLSVAASIDIQFHHHGAHTDELHGAHTDELSPKSASLMADESLLLEPVPDHSNPGGLHTSAHRSINNSEREAQDFTISPVVHPACTSRPPSGESTPDSSCSGAAPSSQNTSKGSKQTKRSKDSKLQAPARPPSDPLAMSAAKAAAARFGVKQTPTQALALRTIETVPSRNFDTEPHHHRLSRSKSTIAVLRTPPGDTEAAAASPPLGSFYRPHSDSQPQSQTGWGPPNAVASHSSAPEQALQPKSHNSLASASGGSSESYNRPQSAPVKAERSSRAAGMDGSEGSLEEPSGGLIRDFNSAVAGGSSRASSTVSDLEPDIGDNDSGAALRALLEDGEEDKTLLGTTFAGIDKTASGVLHTMSGGVRPSDTPSSPSSMAPEPINAMYTQGSQSSPNTQLNTQPNTESPPQERELSPHTDAHAHSNIPTVPTTSAAAPGPPAGPATTHSNSGFLGTPQQRPPSAPDSQEPAVEMSVMDSNPREIQNLESGSSAIDADTSRDPQMSTGFSVQASATYTLSVMSHEGLHSQGLRGTISTADGSGTIRRPLSSVLERTGSGLSAHADRSESPQSSGVHTAVPGDPSHPRTVTSPGNTADAQDVREADGSGSGDGNVYGNTPGGVGAERVRHFGGERSRANSPEGSPRGDAPSLRERFALDQQKHSKPQKQVARQHAIQSMHMPAPARSTSSNSGGSAVSFAATGRRSAHAAAALAVAQAQVRYRMGVQNGQQPMSAPLSAQALPASAAQAAKANTASQQHVLPHQSVSQDERSRRFWQQSQDALAAASQGCRLSTGDQPGLQLEDGPGCFREVGMNPLAVGFPGPQSRDRDPGNSNSKLYSLPGAGDSVSANESPSFDARSSSCLTDRSLESTGKPFGSEFGWSSMAFSTRSRQSPSAAGSGASQGKPHPLAHMQHR